MADNEQTTITPKDASRTNVSSSEHSSNSQEHNGISVLDKEEINRDKYIIQLQKELHELRKYKQQIESESTQPPVTSVVSPPVSSTQIVMSMPFVSQSHCPHVTSYQFPMPSANSGQHDYRIPVFPSYQMTRVCSFETFMSCKPLDYYGSSNLSVTLNWLRDVERIFEVCRCEDEFKVPYAVQLLKGQAITWWNSITAILTPQQRESIRWPNFYIEVCKKFCSNYEMTRFRRESTDLNKVDDMTIDGLIAQFLKTLRFVQQWVPEDRIVIDHFVETLPPEYRTTVRLAESLSQAFNIARTMDSDLKVRELQNKNKSFYRSHGDFSGKGKRYDSQNGKSGNQISKKDKLKWCNKCKARHNGWCTIQSRRCVRCGKLGHEQKDCDYPNYVCWNCKSENHRLSQCPEAKRQRMGMVGGSSSSGHKRKSASSQALQRMVDEDFENKDVDTGMFSLTLF